LLNEGLLLRKKGTPTDGAICEALREHAQKLSELSKNTAKNLWIMGRILADAQEKLASHGNGTFLKWAQDEAGIKRSTVYRLIYVYQAFDLPKLGTTSLSTSVLYALSEPSVPQEARAEALKRAENGETITHARAQAIVREYRPPIPERPPLPPLPQRPEPPDYRQFEKEELRPRLHDAGVPDAPQMLSGQHAELQSVPEERREQARTSLRESIIEAMKGVDTGDDEALDACATEILEILGQGYNSIAIASRVGAALQSGPKTLSDLTQMCIWVCGVSMDGMDRDSYLAWRKRVLRVLDAVTFSNGCGVFEHRLESGQLVYSLLQEPPECT
jgi:hypothetical protein